MSHRRWVWRNHQFVELDLDAPLPPRKAPYVMSDISEYPSVITGERITSRSHHREHLREHGCIEVGNERMTPPSPVELPPVRDDLVRSLRSAPEVHAEARSVSEAAQHAIDP